MKTKLLSIVAIVGLLLFAGCTKTTPVQCPEIKVPEKFFPLKGSELTTLDASLVKVSDGYAIAPPEKQVNPFTSFGEVTCDQGSEAGQNINNIYCEQLMIEKFITNEAGDILEEKVIGIEFVFSNSTLVQTKCFE